MADEIKKPEEQKPRITLDPSKFSIGADGQVVVTDPAFVDALRTAAATEEGNGHGVGVGVVVEF
ncbi:MAG TPA: hypothetical protein VFV38_28390 [Ktedonobacteraceae bacterium]|nr:hypothetical protein [Ktedonobacteraceae bacterium]